MSEPLDLIESSEASLLDTVDHLLNKGLVLTGEVVIGLAGIDLIYLRLTALLCAADRIHCSSARISRSSKRAKPSWRSGDICRNRSMTSSSAGVITAL